MAVEHVSPSMPTHAEEENDEPDCPEGTEGVGTVKLPVTEV